MTCTKWQLEIFVLKESKRKNSSSLLNSCVYQAVGLILHTWKLQLIILRSDYLMRIYWYLSLMLRPWNHKGRHSSGYRCCQEESSIYVKITSILMDLSCRSLPKVCSTQHSLGTFPWPHSLCSPPSSKSLSFSRNSYVCCEFIPSVHLAHVYLQIAFPPMNNPGQRSMEKFCVLQHYLLVFFPCHKGMDDGKWQKGSYFYKAPEKTMP